MYCAFHLCVSFLHLTFSIQSWKKHYCNKYSISKYCSVLLCKCSFVPWKSLYFMLVYFLLIWSQGATFERCKKKLTHFIPADLELPEEKEWDVHVTYISSSTESVMLRLIGEEFSDKLDAYQNKLQEAFRNSSAETPVQEGMTYIAYDDGLYHRVRVISQDDKKVRFLFPYHLFFLFLSYVILLFSQNSSCCVWSFYVSEYSEKGVFLH